MKSRTAARSNWSSAGQWPVHSPCGSFSSRSCGPPVSQDLQASFEMTFGNGLAMEGDEAEKLTERLSRFCSGAAHVSATAEVKA